MTMDAPHGSTAGADDSRVTYTGASSANPPQRSASARSRQTVGSRPVSGVASRPASGRPARPFSGVSSKSSMPTSARSRPLSGRSTAVYSGEEDLEQLRQRYTLLEGDRRAYYETSQWTMQQNRETVVNLKSENRELKKALSAVNSKRDGNVKPSEKEIRLLEKKVHELRSAHDKVVKQRSQGGSKLTRLKESLQALENDKAAMMETDSPALRKIRTLENRLDKAMVKHNEAASISKTYESIVQRLKDERVTFDAQLRAVEDAVKSKTLDLEQLNNMAVEARAAKEEAMAELSAVEAAVERERAHRARELDERRAQVEAAEAQRAQGDPEELERCRAATSSYDDAFRRVQEATGVVSLQEFVDRFQGQEAVKQDLKLMEQETMHTIDGLNRKVELLKSDIAELQYIGSSSAATREEMDSIGEATKSAQVECDAARAEQEKLGRTMIGVRAGLGHLQDMLREIPKGRTTISSAAHGNELVDSLLHIGDQISYVVDMCARDPHALQALAQLHDDPSCFYDPAESENGPPSPVSTQASSLTVAAIERERDDEVLGVGTSIAASMSHDVIPTMGITESVIIDRGHIKTASEQQIASARAGE